MVASSGGTNHDQLGIFGTPAKTTLATTLGDNIDLNGKSASFTVGGTTVTLNSSSTDKSGQAIGTNPNQKAVAEAINKQLTGGYSAYIDSADNLTIVGPNTAITPPVITAASDTIGLGFRTANTLTATNAATTPSASTAAKVTGAGTAVAFPVDLTTASSSLSVGDGTTTATITIDNTSKDKAGTAIGNSATKAKLEEAIQRQLDEAGVNVTAAFNGANKLELTSKGVGTSGTVTLTPGTDGAGLSIGAAGVANPAQTATGIPAGSIDLSGGKSSAFAISDGTTSKNVSISSTSLDEDGNAATQDKVAEAIQVQLDTAGVKATVSFVGDKLQVKSNAVGTGTGAAAPTLTATSDTAGLGLGTTTTASSTPAAGGGTAAAGVTASRTKATDGSSKAAIVGTEQTATKDFSGTKDASFTLKLGSGPLKLITLNNTNLGTSTATNQTAIAKAINDQLNADTGLAG